MHNNSRVETNWSAISRSSILLVRAYMLDAQILCASIFNADESLVFNS